MLKNNIAIGTNAVVTKSFKENSTIVGIPAKKINDLGSKEYINNKWSKN